MRNATKSCRYVLIYYIKTITVKILNCCLEVVPKLQPVSYLKFINEGNSETSKRVEKTENIVTS